MFLLFDKVYIFFVYVEKFSILSDKPPAVNYCKFSEQRIGANIFQSSCRSNGF